ncbi:MAG: hypothetical protein ACOX8O_07235 [Christensenellales bacterium]|jgi:hypothetical protein
MGCEHIMVIRIRKRTDKAPTVQTVLTEFGCSIKTRLGLHETDDDACSETGILILQLCGGGYAELESALNEIEGVKAKLVELD